MYRESPYNQTPFNRPSVPDIDGRFTAHGQGGATATDNYDAGPSVVAHGTGGLSAHLVPDLMPYIDQAFNRLPYNRQLSIFVDGVVSAHAVSSMAAQSLMDFVAAFQADGVGELTAGAVAEIVASAAKMDGVGEFKADAIRERFGLTALHGIGTLTAHASLYHVDEIVIIGSFKPGDRLVIDSRNLTVRLNGQNALHMLQGDFFDLNTGTNVLTYSDDQISRNIRIRVTYRDKYV